MSSVRENHHLPLSLLLLFIALSVAPDLKLGDIQVLEIVQLMRVLLVVCFVMVSGFRIPAAGVWRRYAGPYFLFLLACLVLSLFSLRLSFYPPPDVSLLKDPFFVSLSRLFELAIAVYFMTAVADTLASRPRLIPVCLDVYGFIGAFSAFVSVVSFLLSTMGGISSFFVYGLDPRVRGFFNEGGPYGLFLVSVMLVLILRFRAFPPRHPAVYIAALCFSFLSLLLSQSKAGLLALVALYFIGVLTSRRRERVVLLALLPVLCLTSFLLFRARFNSYNYLYSNFAEALAFRPEDPNLIMGRISAILIVPRMITSHPLLGIGIGNYSLMRNDPDYLQGLPSVDKWDLPGLGILGSAAEFGIPLTVLLLVLLIRPLFQARRKRVPLIIVLTAAFQPVATLLGVNLNFFYPWLVTGLILPLISSAQQKPELKQVDAK